jgi:hypothetical protein
MADETEARADQHKDDIVVTPGGPRRRSHAQAVERGESVEFDEASRPSIVRQPETPEITDRRDITMPRNLVLTPGGFRDRSLVQPVPTGNSLEQSDSGWKVVNEQTGEVQDLQTTQVDPTEVPVIASGWIAYAYWNNGSGRTISSFGTSWEVPQAPETDSGQTIFLFNGIQNFGNNFGILQPVLQWGPSAAGGGPYWSVASWYVTSGGQAFYSYPLVRVNSGRSLHGTMRLTGHAATAFSYKSGFNEIAGATLSIQNIAELLWCNETLEAYGITRCSDYPTTNRTAMRNINIRTDVLIPPQVVWTSMKAPSDCGEHVDIVCNSAFNGEIDIYYR